MTDLEKLLKIEQDRTMVMLDNIETLLKEVLEILKGGNDENM